MQNLNFSIFINAPKEKVWEIMLGDAGYRQWTKPFDEHSHFEGDWSEGSKMLFLGGNKDGKPQGGMYSRVAENISSQYISVEHLGMVDENGTETPWPGTEKGFENYKLKDVDGGTELLIELVNIPDEFCDDMGNQWPKALEVLKAISEK